MSRHSPVGGLTSVAVESVSRAFEVERQMVLKCSYLANIWRPDLLWSVEILARSVTKWNKACGKTLLRLISYMTCTKDYKQVCHVGN